MQPQLQEEHDKILKQFQESEDKYFQADITPKNPKTVELLGDYSRVYVKLSNPYLTKNEEDKRILVIANIAVDPDFRGNGLGSALISSITNATKFEKVMVESCYTTYLREHLLNKGWVEIDALSHSLMNISDPENDPLNSSLQGDPELKKLLESANNN